MAHYGILSFTMPITRSAKKANRASANKRVHNMRRKRSMKDIVHEIEKLVATENHEAAAKKVSAAYKAIDKAAKTNVINSNAAARTKSRLARLVAKKVAK